MRFSSDKNLATPPTRSGFFLTGVVWLVGALLSCYATYYFLTPKLIHDTQGFADKSHSVTEEVDFDLVVAENLPASAPRTRTKPQVSKPLDRIAVNKATVSLEEIEGLVEQGQLGKALSLLTKYVTLNPEDVEGSLMLAMLHMLHSDQDGVSKAVPLLENVLRLDPSNDLALTQLLELHDMNGSGQKGFEFIQELQQKNPESTQLSHAVGQLLLDKGKPNEAVKYLEQAVSTDPSAKHVTDLAAAYSKNGQGQMALQSYSELIQREEDKYSSGAYAEEPELGAERLTNAYLHKAFEYMRQDMVVEARELMETKIKPQVGGDLSKLNRYIEEYQKEYY